MRRGSRRKTNPLTVIEACDATQTRNHWRSKKMPKKQQTAPLFWSFIIPFFVFLFRCLLYLPAANFLRGLSFPAAPSELDATATGLGGGGFDGAGALPAALLLFLVESATRRASCSVPRDLSVHRGCKRGTSFLTVLQLDHGCTLSLELDLRLLLLASGLVQRSLCPERSGSHGCERAAHISNVELVFRVSNAEGIGHGLTGCSSDSLLVKGVWARARPESERGEGPLSTQPLPMRDLALSPSTTHVEYYNSKPGQSAFQLTFHFLLGFSQRLQSALHSALCLQKRTTCTRGRCHTAVGVRHRALERRSFPGTSLGRALLHGKLILQPLYSGVESRRGLRHELEVGGALLRAGSESLSFLHGFSPFEHGQ
jgi:hypothetical protein